jgi:diguanylate cyclase (GGDEF)-like protein
LGDEQQMMGRTSGALWLLCAAVGAAGQAMPGVPHEHQVVVWALIALMAVYGAACLLEWIPWSRLPLRAHLAAILAAQPFIAVGLWATGGVNSYIVPLLVLAMLYSAYFLPGRMAWIGVGALAVSNATPLIYTAPGEDQALARIVVFAMACEGMTLTLQSLKRRLVAAERLQRDLTYSDELTGLMNRDGLETVVAQAVAAAGTPERGRRAQDPGPFTLLRISIGGLRDIDERLGPQAADRVLHELGTRLGELLRPTDALARLDADALAVVAAGAAEPGARRLAQAIRVAAAQVRPAPEEPAVAVTVSWAIFPDDGADAQALLDAVAQTPAAAGH